MPPTPRQTGRVPVTWCAHQAPAFGLKLARPHRFDGTALCVGTIVPDTLLAVGEQAGIDSHTWPSAVLVGLPVGVALTSLFRLIVAPLAPTVLPDLGPFRLRSYGVLADRRPPWRTTVIGVAIGIITHIVLDWFTHGERWVPRRLGYAEATVTWFGETMTAPEALQIVGHISLSVTTAALAWHLGRHRKLDDWYGVATVRGARAVSLGASAAVWWYGTVGAGAAIGAAWAGGAGTSDWVVGVERIALGVYLGAIAGAALVRRRAGVPITGSVRQQRVAVGVGAVEAAEQIRAGDDRLMP